MLDFKKTNVIKTLNPRKGDDTPVIKTAVGKTKNPPRSPFQIEIFPKKDHIRFSQWLFNELQLPNNSLANGTHPDVPGKMLLIVCPGDTGKWATTRGSRDKGRTFKNINLIRGLRELGFNENQFNLEHVGDDEEGKKYYTFEPYTGEGATSGNQQSDASTEEPVVEAEVEDEAPVKEDKFN